MFAVSRMIPVLFENVIFEMMISEAPDAICICSAPVPASVTTLEDEQPTPYELTVISFPDAPISSSMRVSVQVSPHLRRIWSPGRNA